MTMKKAEMEAHAARYHALMAKVRAVLQDGLYCRAVELALSSWDHIDGMMQFERKYEDAEFDSVEGIDLVLKLAPLLLDLRSLDRLESLLKTQRRIERDTSADMGDKLDKARALIGDAHRLWDHLELHPETRQDELRRILGGDQAHWRSVAEAWDKMGLLRRTPEAGSYRLSLSTRMGEIVSGKCPSCGSVAEAPKAMFLEESSCPTCGTTVLFVLLPKESAVASKG